MRFLSFSVFIQVAQSISQMFQVLIFLYFCELLEVAFCKWYVRDPFLLEDSLSIGWIWIRLNHFCYPAHQTPYDEIFFCLHVLPWAQEHGLYVFLPEDLSPDTAVIKISAAVANVVGIGRERRSISISFSFSSEPETFVLGPVVGGIGLSTITMAERRSLAFIGRYPASRLGV